MSFDSPLRYPGGKGKLAPFFSQLISANGLNDGTYVEPFAGGAGVAVTLLLNNRVRRIVINDVDPSIYAFWKAVVDQPEELVRLIRETPVTIDEWRKQRTMQKDHSINSLKLGFSTFFLNRTNRSGVLDGGPIGGLDQQGADKIDARYNQEQLAQRVERIGALSDRIDVYGLDAEIFMKDALPKYSEDDTLLYLDPPYFQMGADLYMNYYDYYDHRRLSVALDDTPYKWVVSYDHVVEALDFYRPYQCRKFCLDYSAYKRRKGREVMFFSNNIELPLALKLPGEENPDIIIQKTIEAELWESSQ